MEKTAELLKQEGRQEEAITWYQRATETGETDALHRVVALIRELGREASAEQLQLFGREPDGTIAERWESLALARHAP
jgi:hypothetical protein